MYLKHNVKNKKSFLSYLSGLKPEQKSIPEILTSLSIIYLKIQYRLMICQSVLLLIYKWGHHSCTDSATCISSQRMFAVAGGIEPRSCKLQKNVLTDRTILTYALIKVKGSMYKQPCSKTPQNVFSSLSFT